MLNTLNEAMNPVSEIKDYILQLERQRLTKLDCRVSVQSGTIADVQLVAGGKYVRVFDISGGLTDRVKSAVRDWLESVEASLPKGGTFHHRTAAS